MVTALADTAERPGRAMAPAAWRALHQVQLVPSHQAKALARVFALESLPAAQQDLSAVLPEALPDSASAWFRELAAVQAVYSGRPEAVSVVALNPELVPVPRSFRQTGCMREPPA